MGRKRKELDSQQTEIITDSKTSNQELNVEIVEELMRLVNKYPNDSIGKILYNITPDTCITMGDLFFVDGKAILAKIQNTKRKRLKDEVTYGET